MSSADERIRRSWDENAAVWTDAVRAGAIASRRSATDDAVVAAVRACGGTRVLDVGCGEGWLARRLAGSGCDVTGFDASDALIERARQDGGGRFIHMSYEEFAGDPTRVGSGYDVAVCNFSLLAESIAQLLRGLREIVGPDGCLVVQTVHPVAVPARADRDGWMEETFQNLPGSWVPMPWYFRTPESWLRLLAATGWQAARRDEPLHPATGQPLSLILTATSGEGLVHAP